MSAKQEYISKTNFGRQEAPRVTAPAVGGNDEYEYYYEYLEDEDGVEDTRHNTDYDLVPLSNKVIFGPSFMNNTQRFVVKEKFRFKLSVILTILSMKQLNFFLNIPKILKIDTKNWLCTQRVFIILT